MSRERPAAADAGPRPPGGPRARILEAAAREISERGFHGMSMRELARGAGMSLGNTYNYFSSKDEILFALQREAFEALVRSAQEALSGVNGASARLYVFVAHHVRTVVRHPAVMRVLVHEAATPPPEHRREVRRLKERYFALGRAIVAELADGAQEGSKADDAELDRTAYNLFGMLNWVYGWYEPRLHGSPADVARSIHRIAVGGVAGDAFSAEEGDLQSSLDAHLESVETPPLLDPHREGAEGTRATGMPDAAAIPAVHAETGGGTG